MDLVFIAFIAGIAGFMIGRGLTKDPPEEELMARLVQIRLGRKMAAITRADVDREADAAADRLATPSR